MDEALIENWNSVVSEGDIVYNLGDLSMNRGKGEKVISYYTKILSQLNGRHILILGNHDHMKPYQYVNCGIESVHTSLILPKTWKTRPILLAHDPAVATAMPHNMMMICGHVHDTFTKLTSPKKILNVGVDVWDYKPVEYSVALDALKNKERDKDFTFDDLNKFGRHNKNKE